MADGHVELDVMNGGSAVAVDIVGGTAHQYTKMEWGGSGTVTPVSAANPLPVAVNGTLQGGTVGTVASVAQVHNAGTIQALPDLPGGTIDIIAGGSIVNIGGYLDSVVNGSMHVIAGTVRNNPKPTTNLLAIGSVWGTNSGTAGTLIAAVGAGTSIFVNELSISNEGTSTLTAGIGYGTAQQGTTVLARVAMAGNGGIQKSFPIPVGGSHPNLPLVMWTTGSGTASFNVSYWTEAQ